MLRYRRKRQLAIEADGIQQQMCPACCICHGSSCVSTCVKRIMNE
jgi:hypothetical protein